MSFQQHFDSIRPSLSLVESEETWDTIAHGITALAAACSDTESYTPTELVSAIRSITRPVISAMNSERGRLSGVAIDLVAVLASSLGVAFEPLLSHFFPVLLTLCSRTSKVTVTRARSCILTIIDLTHLPSALPYLAQSVTDKSVSLRLTIAESTLACMNCFNPPDLEKEPRAKEIEAILRATARDASADVRKAGRKMFEAYKLLLPTRLESFTAPLTPTTRKYLDIQNSAADKTKPSHSHLAAPSKVAQLSSSTSAVRGPSSRRPATHTRSASSPSVAPPAVNKPGPVKANMPPPKLPEPVLPSRQVTTQPAAIVERKRVVSMSAVRSVASKAGERGPTLSTNPHSARRPLPVHETARAAAVVVARRVPVAEAGPARPRIDNSVSTPAIRHVPASAAGASSKQPAPRTGPHKPGRTVTKTAEKPKGRETGKSSLTQPTLSQLARAKSLEKRAPVSTRPRPLPKTVSRKALPSSKEKQPPATTDKTARSAGALAGLDDEPQNDVEIEDDVGIEDDANEKEKDEAIITENAGETVIQSEEGDLENASEPAEEEGLATPQQKRILDTATSKTPISELLLSIERGFIFTPSAPLSPPQSYLGAEQPTSFAIPFPTQTIWPKPEQQTEDSGAEGIKPVEGIRRLESRRALGNVGINK